MPSRENERDDKESLPVNCDAFIAKNVVWEGINPLKGKKVVPYTSECFSFELDARSAAEKKAASIKNEAD